VKEKKYFIGRRKKRRRKMLKSKQESSHNDYLESLRVSKIFHTFSNQSDVKVLKGSKLTIRKFEQLNLIRKDIRKNEFDFWSNRKQIGNGWTVDSIELDINSKCEMAHVTEGERIFESCRITESDGLGLTRELGCVVLLKVSSYKILGIAELHRTKFESIESVGREDSEAEARLHLDKSGLINSVQRKLSTIYHRKEARALYLYVSGKENSDSNEESSRIFYFLKRSKENDYLCTFSNQSNDKKFRSCKIMKDKYEHLIIIDYAGKEVESDFWSDRRFVRDNWTVDRVELKVNLKCEMAHHTEGERIIESYRITENDGLGLSQELGCIVLLKGNSYKILGMAGLCRIIFASLKSVGGENSEAEAIMHLGNNKLMDSVQKSLSIVSCQRKAGALCWFFSMKEEGSDRRGLSIMLKKAIHLMSMLFVWSQLRFIIFGMLIIVIAGLCESYSERGKFVENIADCEILSVGETDCLKGEYFEADLPIVDKQSWLLICSSGNPNN
jgi:hypothetical protein